MKSKTALAFGIEGVAPLVCTAKADAAVAGQVVSAVSELKMVDSVVKDNLHTNKCFANN